MKKTTIVMLFVEVMVVVVKIIWNAQIHLVGKMQFCTVTVCGKWWYIWESLVFKRRILKHVKKIVYYVDSNN
jgi:hypothetical protein